MGNTGIWWVDVLYGLGVAGLTGAAELFGITYAELCVYVFGVAGPLVLAAMTLVAWWYRRRYVALKERLDGPVRAAAREEPESWTSPLVELERESALREPPPLSTDSHEDEALGGDFLRVPRRDGLIAEEPPAPVDRPRPARLRAPLAEPDLEDVRPDNDDRPFRRAGVVAGAPRRRTVEEAPRLDVRLRPSDRL